MKITKFFKKREVDERPFLLEKEWKTYKKNPCSDCEYADICDGQDALMKYIMNIPIKDLLMTDFECHLKGDFDNGRY